MKKIKLRVSISYDNNTGKKIENSTFEKIVEVGDWFGYYLGKSFYITDIDGTHYECYGPNIDLRDQDIPVYFIYDRVIYDRKSTEEEIKKMLHEVFIKYESNRYTPIQ